MKRLVNKLHSKGGATILFAILVFMLCALVGAAALTAAAANSGRYTHVKAEQQEYLSMSSAVNLMREELVDKTFTAQVTRTETKDASGNPVAGSPVVGWAVGSLEYDGGFSGQLLEVFKGFYLNELSSSYPDVDISALDAPSSTTYKTELTFTTEDEDIDKYKVTAELEVDKDFNITVKFYFTDGSGRKSDVYGTNLIIRATVDGDGITTASSSRADGTNTITTTTYTMKVTWLEANTTVVKSTLETEGA